MTLVTRVSVAFLVALALALGAFSSCLYYLTGLRLRLAVDQELESTLDHFGDRREAASSRVTWAVYDESGRRIESMPDARQPMVLDGRDLEPLAVDVATTIVGADGRRWRILAPGRTPPARAARGQGEGPSTTEAALARRAKRGRAARVASISRS